MLRAVALSVGLAFTVTYAFLWGAVAFHGAHLLFYEGPVGWVERYIEPFILAGFIGLQMWALRGELIARRNKDN